MKTGALVAAGLKAGLKSVRRDWAQSVDNIAKDTILTGGKYCNNSGRALNILIIANNGAGAGLINCRPATSFHQYRTVSYKQTKQKIPLIQNITHMATLLSN